MRPPEGHVLSFADLSSFCATRRAAGEKLALTNGCFDVLHAGHIQLLRQAAAQADVLIVGVNDDAAVRALKGPDRPLVRLEDRLQILAAVRWVDAVVSFPQHTAGVLIERVRPDVYVKGADYDPAQAGQQLPELATLERLGIPARYVPLLEGRSTRELLARAQQQR